ncbi:Polyisoprenoid-binding protein YceI [Polynucleobacter meluiroseus]|uniref:Polyisoprenoid-binding protein YceI n=2 Tax=Polynucleobacter meluiroseus TaxID=1938814 RepID=A0A240E0V1_9BURK|nr:Polyisoprenoid-binding protein YceI [Polynucleobacter meluiroseus]
MIGSLSALAQTVEVFAADPEHTFVSLSYQHLSYSVQTSRFDHVTGTISLNEDKSGGKVDIIIDTKSISTGSVTFNQRIQEEDFFATETFPTATFKSDNIAFNVDGISTIQGELTIKGITKPITVDVAKFACARNLITFAYTCGANATAKLKRSDFNMGKYTPFVGDEVALNIVIEASRQ